MDLWKELNDFSDLAQPTPCPVDGELANPTVVGNHFKCPKCEHLFNKDGAVLPEGIECHCDPCMEKQKAQALMDQVMQAAEQVPEEEEEKPKKKGKRKKAK